MPQRLQPHIDALAQFPGIKGCALVESETGMAWHFAGHFADMEHVGETAVEFWRVQERLNTQLVAFGELRSVAYSFEKCVLALFPCDPTPSSLVLVCVAEKTPVDWAGFGRGVAGLRQIVSMQIPTT